MKKTMKSVVSKFYAVRKGHVPGIYTSWDSCSEQVKGFGNASFKKFDTLEEAQSFMIPDDISIIKPKEIEETKTTKDLFKYYGNFRDFLSPKFNPSEWYKYFLIFTDGSKTPDKSGYAVFINLNSEYNTYTKVDATNNYCELNAILTTLNIIKTMSSDSNKVDGRMYIVVSDSEYGIKSATTHMDKWKKEDRTNYKNKETLDAIHNTLETLDSLNIPVGFLHVRSHTKKPSDSSTFEYALWFGNKCVDTLAKDGILNVSTLKG